MANYATLKAAIAAAIKQNGNNEITGNLLQQQLLAMVNSLGAGYQYAGIATPATNPGTPDQNVFYLAGPGIYPNFAGLEIQDNNLGVLKYDGQWSVETISGIGGGGGATLGNYVAVASIADLPDPGQPTIGYLVGTNLYLYVGTGGDTLDGKYQNCGQFRGPAGPDGPQGQRGPLGPQGPQGLQGPQGNTGSSVDYPFELVNNLTTDDATKALSAAQGVRIIEKLAPIMGPDWIYLDILSIEPFHCFVYNGEWTENTALRLGGIIVSISGISHIRIVASASQACSYAFLTSDSHIVGENVAFSAQSGYTSLKTLSAGSTIEIDTPGDSPYLYLYTGDWTTKPKLPQSVSYPITPVVEGDDAPTKDSVNFVKSGALYDLLGHVETLSPDTEYPQYFFFASTGKLVGNATRYCKKYAVTPGQKVSISTYFSGDTTIELINVVNANGVVVGTDVSSTTGGVTLDGYEYIIPDGGAFLYVNANDTLDNISVTTRISVDGLIGQLQNIVDTIIGSVPSREISILFIGNSLTQDAVSYVPYLLRNLAPSVKFKFYIWYNGGFTLGQAYQKMINNQACEIFSVCENGTSWGNVSAAMSSVLSTYTFDIVCLQEYFNYKTSFTEADLADFNNVVSYIRSNYNKNFKVVSFFHAPKRGAGVHDIFNLTKSGNELILKKTAAESLLAPGIAVYRALSTSLNSLGDQGGLSPDGTHTQEGLPCLLQAFVVFIWIMRQLAVPISIENCQIQMTTAIYNTINVPGPNLGTGVIQGTQSENWLAQDVAILGDKEGQGIENNSFINITL